MDLSTHIIAEQLNFTSDASAAKNLVFGATFGNRWFAQQWEPGYIDEAEHQPSIAYLELYTLTATVLTWGHHIKNCRIMIFCDNMSRVNMVNQLTSSCKNCMYLIRLLTLNGLVNNRRVFA